ncbi:unnamed protein product, partial [Rotaria sordida]
MCNEVISNADIDCRITLVGNEFDQRHIRVVSSNGAKRFADERNIHGRAISNEIANWHQSNIIDGFGSIAGFKNENTSYIIITTSCDSQANLINLNDLSQPPLSRTMKTSCTQPTHSLADRYLLALGTIHNDVGGSFPESLYVFDALSEQWNYEIVNFGNIFSGKYQVLHPSTGFSSLNLNAAEPILYV